MREIQKIKLFRLLQILSAYTDQEHGITMAEILEKLALYGVQAERKSIYRDLECINGLGEFRVERVKTAGGQNFYYLRGRRFSTAELRLLADAVRASRALSEADTEALLGKLAALGSRYEAKKLKLAGIAKAVPKASENALLKNIEILLSAIRTGMPVSFQLLEWSPERRLRLYKDTYICVFPLALYWENDACWLWAEAPADGVELRFRVERLRDVQAEKGEKLRPYNIRLQQPAAAGSFSGENLIGGSKTDIRLRADRRAIAALLDRFGREIPVMPNGDGTFDTRVCAELSDTFLCWLAGLEGAKVLEPACAVERLREIARRILEAYRNTEEKI